MIDILSGTLLILGSLLALIAGIGLLRFPDVLTRLHAAAKPQSLGVLLVLTGLALRINDRGAIAVLALAAIFQLITAPVSAHMLGRSALRAGHIDREDLTLDDLADVDPNPNPNPENT